MATLREHIDRIHQEIPITQVLADLGYAVRPDGGLREQQFSCDLHGDGHDGKPSARVYPDSASFYCFACGLARDAVALLRAKEGLSLKGAIHKLEVTYGLPALPWEDDRPVAEVTRDTVQARLDPSRTFQDELKTFYSTLGWVTQERVLQMDQTLAFWEAGDQVSYKVGEGLMPEETGYKVLKVLQERLDQALRGCE